MGGHGQSFIDSQSLAPRRGGCCFVALHFQIQHPPAHRNRIVSHFHVLRSSLHVLQLVTDAGQIDTDAPEMQDVDRCVAGRPPLLVSGS